MKDVGRWLRRWDGSQNGQSSREAPGLSVPGHVSITPSPGEESLECSSSDEDEVSLSQQESCADFPESVAVTSGSF